jgi:hypothetical protein
VYIAIIAFAGVSFEGYGKIVELARRCNWQRCRVVAFLTICVYVLVMIVVLRVRDLLQDRVTVSFEKQKMVRSKGFIARPDVGDSAWRVHVSGWKQVKCCGFSTSLSQTQKMQ